MSDYSISSVTSVRVVETSQASTPASQGTSAAQNVASIPGIPAAPVAPAAPPVTATGAIPSPHGRTDQVAAKQAAQAPGQLEAVAAKQLSQKTEEQKKAAAAREKEDLPVKDLNKVTIRFSVDEKTNSITVYVIDKASKRVLRSIPPEDLNKMAAGDLLQLMA